MTLTPEMIRAHHGDLVAELDRLLPVDPPRDWMNADPAAVVHFLRDELLPHAHEEEREVYDVIDAQVKASFRVTETMRLDHAYIQQMTERLAALAGQLAQAPQTEQEALAARFWREADRLGAVIRLHLQKEETAYLPLLAQLAVAGGADSESAETVLDVREIPPVRRHELIFETYEQLQPGQAFILVNDHDPRPLYYQFQAEHTGEFTWDYLEQGPVVWRVRIGRR